MSAPDRTAGIVTRALAAVVDAAVVLVMMGIALLCVAGVRFLVSPVSFRWPSPSWPLSLAVGAALATAYLTAAWATSGRSCGAAVAGVRVRSVGGGPLGWVRAGLRASLCVAFPPGLLWCVLSRRRRSVQDLVLGSVVVYDWDDDAGIRPGADAAGGSAAHPPRVTW
jgi:uncharacterized RDD family membrane protein YckC